MATIEFVPNMVDFISKDTFDTKILPLLKVWLEDTVHQVRVETVKCLMKLKSNNNSNFDQLWLENLLELWFGELHKH